MIYLRQSTASQEIPLGPFLDDADFNTPEDGLTIANTDIKLWITGATTLANKTSGGATDIAGGVYYTVLDATDTATCGPLKIFCHPAGSIAVQLECCVLPQNVYDSFVAGTSQVTPATIAAEVVIEMDATSLLPTILTAVNGIPTAINDDIVDGTITWAQQKFYTLSVLQGDATGLLGANKDFMNQDGDPAVSSVHSGGTRTVTLTPP